jgi:uncharacterized membrane protein YhaH (DUF805 family)
MTLALIAFSLLQYDSSDHTNTGLAAFFAAMGVLWFLVFLVLFVFSIYCVWRVAVKCGYPGAYSLLLLIPVVNIILQLIWVFSEWPIEAELKRCRAQLTAPKVP